MLNIIPKPLRVQEIKGEFRLSLATQIGGNSLFEAEIAYTQSIIKGSMTAKAVVNHIEFITCKDIKSEGYRLEVKENLITISASDVKGAFYAVQTLRQISALAINIKQKTLAVPCCIIDDAPRYVWRGFMLDEARHFWGKKVVKKTLDMMALYKLNRFHWHLSEDQGWRIEIKKYPLLTSKGTVRNNTQLNLIGYNAHKEKHDDKEYGRGLFYTQEDIKEIVEYARKLCIEIIPEIDMPGHLVSAIACYPELSCFGDKVDVSNRWGVMDNIGCCGKPAIYTFVKDIIDELAELFPAPYFHLGGDEVPKGNWKKCPDCQAKIKELGLKDENELQGYFNNQILQHVNSKGKKLIGWNELLEATTLSKDVIIQWWTSQGEKYAQDWIKEGNKVILSYTKYFYLDYFYATIPLQKTYEFEPTDIGVDEKDLDAVIGIEAPLWTEYIRDQYKFDLNLYPRLQALAENAWTSRANKNFEEFDKRLDLAKKVLTSNKIDYAKRSVYTMQKGLKGIIRKAKILKKWREGVTWEVELNKSAKE